MQPRENFLYKLLIYLGHCYKYSLPVGENKGFSVSNKTPVFHPTMISAHCFMVFVSVSFSVFCEKE